MSNKVIFFCFKSIPVEGKPAFCLFLDNKIFKYYLKTDFSRKDAVADAKSIIEEESKAQKPKKTVVKFIM